jgi:mRNA interferase YafQ
MLTPEYTNQFKRDYKRSEKRNLDMSLIDKLIEDLIEEKPLAEKYKDHLLKGEYIGCRECHILPDWLLVYRIVGESIIFVRNGTHPDIFKM